MAFVVAGVGTMIVGLLARWYIRTYPSEHPSINKAELDHIVAANGAETSSKKYRLADIKPYLKQRNVIALICGWVCYSFVFYGLMTWLPLYFRATYGFDIKSMGGAMALIFLLCFVGQLTGGYIMDKWRSKGAKQAALCIRCWRFRLPPLVLVFSFAHKARRQPSQLPCSLLPFSPAMGQRLLVNTRTTGRTISCRHHLRNHELHQ